MKKKIILLLVFVTLVTGGVFADGWNNSFKFDSGSSKQKGALFVNLSPTINYLILGGFGIGLAWEGRINDFSTYLIDAEIGGYQSKYSWYGYGYDYTRFDFAVEGNYRYYFFKSAIDKLFINGGIGFGLFSRKWSYSSGYTSDKITDTEIWTMLFLPIYAGYKVIIGPGFVLELDVGYRIAIGLTRPEGYAYNYWTLGNGIYGISVGWAF
jgi:hypothetical protein